MFLQGQPDRGERRRFAVLHCCLYGLLAHALLPVLHGGEPVTPWSGEAVPGSPGAVVSTGEGDSTVSHDCDTCPLCQLTSQGKPLNAPAWFAAPVPERSIRSILSDPSFLHARGVDLSAPAPRAPPTVSIP